MCRRLSSRLHATACAFATVVATLLLYACQDPANDEPEFARVNARHQLTVAGTGTHAAGGVTSDRGGINCTVSASGGVGGKCSQAYKSGAIVTLYFAPASGARLAAVTGNCAPSGETGLACDVVMDKDQPVTVNFDAALNLRNADRRRRRVGERRRRVEPARHQLYHHQWYGWHDWVRGHLRPQHLCHADGDGPDRQLPQGMGRRRVRCLRQRHRQVHRHLHGGDEPGALDRRELRPPRERGRRRPVGGPVHLARPGDPCQSASQREGADLGAVGPPAGAVGSGDQQLRERRACRWTSSAAATRCSRWAHARGGRAQRHR